MSRSSWFERAAVLALGLAMAGGSVLAGRHWVVVRVAGASMTPALLPGDLVLAERADTASIGDIVLVAEGGARRYLHRVRERSPSGFTLKGDANPTADQDPVSARDITGVVRLVVPAGAVVEWWRARSGYATLAAQPNSENAMTETTADVVPVNREKPRD